MKLDISILLIQINPRLNVTESSRRFWGCAGVSASPGAALLVQTLLSPSSAGPRGSCWSLENPQLPLQCTLPSPPSSSPPNVQSNWAPLSDI